MYDYRRVYFYAVLFQGVAEYMSFQLEEIELRLYMKLIASSKCWAPDGSSFVFKHVLIGQKLAK